ncbi:hypothetical protein [Haloferula sp. BvORR071]|nr:hypothetical protein [Haloferula sp. BvORR071]
MSLLLAIAIWFLIRDYLKREGQYYDPDDRPPKARLVPEDEQ